MFALLLQPLSELTPSDSERLITVSGGRDKVLRAVALILNTVSAQQILGNLGWAAAWWVGVGVYVCVCSHLKVLRAFALIVKTVSGGRSDC
jgi:hypothetical protein